MPQRNCEPGAATQSVQGQPSANLPLDGALWRFAVALYGQAGVPEACLGLQNRFELDVNLLLFAAWLGVEHRLALWEAEAALARQRTAAWHAEIVRPLRRIRQHMKSGPVPAPSSETESLRDKLKAVEIESERIELALLQTIAGEVMREGMPGIEGGPLLRRNIRMIVAQFAPDGIDPEAERHIGTIARAALVLSREAS
jgi:uncharacterized protein (TIGR02444 family)